MSSLCDNFINQPAGLYRPLACKPIVVQTRELKGTGYANKQQFFFLTKPNTIRENATIDLLYPTPSWYETNINNPIVIPDNTRVTTQGAIRIIDTGLIRVTI